MNLKAVFYFVLASILLQACETEEPETFWYNYGTYINSDLSDQGFILKMDNGDTIIPIDVNYVADGITEQSRIIAVFAMESLVGQTIYGDIKSLDAILTKDILELSDAISDSIGFDPVYIWEENLWVSENHLNIVFHYYGGATTHYINLVKPIGEQTDSLGRQIFEFRHNENGDYLNYRYSGIVSFNMWSVYEPGMDTLKFVVKSSDYYQESFEWEGTYIYHTEEQQSKLPVIGEPEPYFNDFK